MIVELVTGIRREARFSGNTIAEILGDYRVESAIKYSAALFYNYSGTPLASHASKYSFQLNINCIT